MTVGRYVLVCVGILAGPATAAAQTVAVTPIRVELDVAQANAPRQARLKGFSAVLLTGEMEPSAGRSGGPAEAEIPPAVKGALASITSFLPYKVYKLTDTAVMSAVGGVTTVMLLRDSEMNNLGLFRLSLGPNSASSPWMVSVVVHQLNTLNSDKDQGREIIRTTVPISAGETVVVGTSPAGGGKRAYILLLTALADK